MIKYDSNPEIIEVKGAKTSAGSPPYRQKAKSIKKSTADFNEDMTKRVPKVLTFWDTLLIMRK